ncbi:MAG: aldo/keto reductase [Gammaproteobacteria bacterium]|nr:aldo/keto reductase [Gammaproteobacteria bacterium]
MKISRREMLKIGVGTGAGLLLGELPAFGQDQPLLMRAIPSSGEEIPAVGLGSARTFNVGSSVEERAPLTEVLRLFHESGGRFFDTAPSYGSSESVAGQLVQELGIQDDLFFATKISTGGGREAGLEQEEGSLRSWGRDTIDLNQVHNLRDVDIHLRTIRQAKEEGRTRYVGVTTSFPRQYQQMEQVLRAEELDFVQINYSIGEREAAERLLPLAQDRGIAVVVNEPYNVGRVFGAVSGRELPEWAVEFDCRSWGQFFLKYILSHPAVTVIIPATSDPVHLVDNMGAGVGLLPDERTRTRMEDLFDSLT